MPLTDLNRRIEAARERRLDFVRKCILDVLAAGGTVEDATQRIVNVWDAEARVLSEHALTLD